MVGGSAVRVMLLLAAACVLLFGSPADAKFPEQRFFKNEQVTPCNVFSQGYPNGFTGAAGRAYNPEFSNFGRILNNFLEYGELFQTTWCGSGGGARYTILAPNNPGLSAGLKKLHARYGTESDPNKFHYNGPPLDYSDKLSEALLGIADFHFIPVPINFYSNSKVLKATKSKPLKLPVTYAFRNPNAHLSVYTEKGVVYAKPSGGGLLEGPAFKIEKTHTTLGAYQKGDNSLIFIHTIDGLLVPNRVIDQKKVKSNGQRTSTISLPTLLKAIGGCSEAYGKQYSGSRAKGCSKNN